MPSPLPIMAGERSGERQGPGLRIAGSPPRFAAHPLILKRGIFFSLGPERLRGACPGSGGSPGERGSVPKDRAHWSPPAARRVRRAPGGGNRLSFALGVSSSSPISEPVGKSESVAIFYLLSRPVIASLLSACLLSDRPGSLSWQPGKKKTFFFFFFCVCGLGFFFSFF